MRLTKKFLHLKNSSNISLSRIMAICLMMAGGGVSIAASHFYNERSTVKEVRTIENSSAQEKEIKEEPTEKPAAREMTEPEFLPSPEKFNLALRFDEEADPSNPMESKGGIIYSRLSAEEAEWLGNIYNYSGMAPREAASRLGLPAQSVTGKYNKNDENHNKEDPSTWIISSWENVNMKIYDGDGGALSGDSNLKEILSMASVYTYYHDYRDEEAFLQYARQLWKDSHTYKVSISDVYYCEGCLDDEAVIDKVDSSQETAAEKVAEGLGQASAENESLEGQDTETETLTAEGEQEDETSEESVLKNERLLTATPGEIALGPGYYLDLENKEAQETPPPDFEEDNEIICPGHVDLNISIHIKGLNEKRNNLYSIDKQGNTPDGKWPGWTEETKNHVAILCDQDWFNEYQISISNVSPGVALGASEINAYMQMLPDEISQTRRDLIRFALESVGKVPYYWGGKPSARGYAGNSFGAIVSPDESGRVRKGLDCSGWINWVYWSVTGSRLPYESTAGLVSCGAAIQPEELRPGDILIRRGDEAHVVMFLGWGSNGNIVCIHESSFPSNNVVVGEKEFNWQYFRKLVE